MRKADLLGLALWCQALRAAVCPAPLLMLESIVSSNHNLLAQATSPHHAPHGTHVGGMCVRMTHRPPHHTMRRMVHMLPGADVLRRLPL
jgi:hypothetical protein